MDIMKEELGIIIDVLKMATYRRFGDGHHERGTRYNYRRFEDGNI